MFVLIWMNFLRHDEHFDDVFYSYSVALCPAHAAPHAGGQHQSYVPFRIVSVGRYVPLYHNTVTAARCSCARVTLKAKVSSSLTDVWQQLFEQQDITVYAPFTFTPGCMKTTPGDTDWNRHAGTCLSETNEGRQWAEAASDWNVVSNQQSFIDQALDQWQDCFNARLIVKSKHWTFAIMFLRNCHDF